MASTSEFCSWRNSARETDVSFSPYQPPQAFELDPGMLALMQDIVEWVNLRNHTISPLTYQCSFLFSRTVNCASVTAQQK